MNTIDEIKHQFALEWDKVLQLYERATEFSSNANRQAFTLCIREYDSANTDFVKFLSEAKPLFMPHFKDYHNYVTATFEALKLQALTLCQCRAHLNKVCPILTPAQHQLINSTPNEPDTDTTTNKGYEQPTMIFAEPVIRKPLPHTRPVRENLQETSRDSYPATQISPQQIFAKNSLFLFTKRQAQQRNLATHPLDGDTPTFALKY